MILRQLFDYESYTYTYLVGDENTGEACLIDPVQEHVDRYLQLVSELDLKLILAMDTHVHADHVTALGSLKELTQCQTLVGLTGQVSCASDALTDGKEIAVGALRLKAIYTPGHTEDSYCFYMEENDKFYLFSGDTLLIRGTGRTDFQNGDSHQLYHSLHDRLLQLPPETLVLPAHDYKGWTSSTLAEEKQHNPRLQLIDPVQTCRAYGQPQFA
ncbi:UNVERIFIED_CONTAM: hypothetical protein GTU68_039529 [Idotea baltica]|nr:hypothetical protein [Idotea baltica]